MHYETAHRKPSPSIDCIIQIPIVVREAVIRINRIIVSLITKSTGLLAEQLSCFKGLRLW